MKIIVIPHTHWDREWFFTNEVSDNLLKFNIDNYLNFEKKYEYFYLDGQVSLLDDYLDYADKKNKQKLIKMIKDKKFIVGPLYTQPDVFNSLGETTIRNIDYASKVLKKHNLPNNKIFYCPDTFGFGANFPQILNFKNFTKFVFWRGLSKKYADSDYNYWNGNANSKLTTYRYKFGYGKPSYLFPWNELNKNNIKKLAKDFDKIFSSRKEYEHFQKQAYQNNDLIMLPMGDDQTPFHPLMQEFFEEVNKISKDEWVIGNFEMFFNNVNKPRNKIHGPIEYGLESKIHQTIATSRYDFKKLYRDSEIALYHQLEPLELFYKIIDKNYYINNDLILKPLLCMQAHDILGGCVTDNTDFASKQKLVNVQENIEAKKAIIMKQLATELEMDDNQILIFNPDFDLEPNNLIFKKVYTSKAIKGNYSDSQMSVYVLNSQDYKYTDNCFESEILIINKSLSPFNLSKFNFNQLKVERFEQENFSDYRNLLNFEIQQDNGDLYDGDWIDGKIFEYQLKIKSSIIKKFKDFNLIEIKGDLQIDKNSCPFELRQVQILNDYYYHLEITNQFKNVNVTWNPPIEFKKIPKYLQHLGIDSYVHNEILNWKDLGYADWYLNVKKQSGLIFDNQNYLCSKGTNLFSWESNKLKIYLYRSCGVLGKKELKTRPGVASGLDKHLMMTPNGQMINQKLVFEFKYGAYEKNIHKKLNSFYKTPIIFHNGSTSKIKSFIEKFVFIKKNLKIKIPFFKSPNGFISSSYYENNSIKFVFVDFDEKSKNFNKLSKEEIKLK